jgi:hypothetical protein
MLAVRSRIFQFCLMLAAALSVSISPAASQGYTPEQQQACSGDAFRLCSSEIPDVERITVCMIRNKSQLTPGCRVFFRTGHGAKAAQHQAGDRARASQRRAAQVQEGGEAGRELTGAAFRIFAGEAAARPWPGRASPDKPDICRADICAFTRSGVSRPGSLGLVVNAVAHT